MEQKIVKGMGTLASILEPYGKVLLVHGKSMERYAVREFLGSAECVDFTQFQPNPVYEDVCRGVELFRSRSCDAIVAVGGGSAIDTAKCIKLFCKMEGDKPYLEQETKDTGVPLIAIPTTAGTGSESTANAVIYRDGAKQSVAHESLLPDYAVLAPELLKELPLYQKKCTMLDALCQAIESWWSVSATEESIGYAKRAVAAVMENWEAYLFAPTEAAAEKVLEAANLSGRAIRITATTAPHAMSYKLTTQYQIPHGHAVALCLAQVWDYVRRHTDACQDPHGVSYLEGVLEAISALVSPEAFSAMLKTCGMEHPISQSRTAELEALVQSVNPLRLKNNPVDLSRETLKALYERIVIE